MISPTYGFQFRRLTELEHINLLFSLGTGKCCFLYDFCCELSSGTDMREFIALGEPSLNR